MKCMALLLLASSMAFLPDFGRAHLKTKPNLDYEYSDEENDSILQWQRYELQKHKFEMESFRNAVIGGLLGGISGLFIGQFLSTEEKEPSLLVPTISTAAGIGLAGGCLTGCIVGKFSVKEPQPPQAGVETLLRNFGIQYYMHNPNMHVKRNAFYWDTSLRISFLNFSF